MFCTKGEKPIQKKIVVAGDGACGKTSLLNVFTRGFFPQVRETGRSLVFYLILVRIRSTNPLFLKITFMKYR